MNTQSPLATAAVSIVQSATRLSLGTHARAETIEQSCRREQVIFMEGRKTMGCRGEFTW